MEMDRTMNLRSLKDFSNLILIKLKASFSFFTNPTHSPKFPVQVAQYSLGCKSET